MRKVLLALASSFLASFASANPLVIDPDGLAEGTDLSTAFPGVTLRHFTIVADTSGNGLLVEDNVYAKECPATSDPNSRCSALGSGYFGYQMTTGEIAGSFVGTGSGSIGCLTTIYNYCHWYPHHFLEVTFDFAVQAATIDATHLSDWPQAWAFDAAGNQLQINQQRTWHQQCGPSDHNNFCHQTLTVTPVTGQISRVIFSGQGGFVNLDKLTYTLP